MKRALYVLLLTTAPAVALAQPTPIGPEPMRPPGAEPDGAAPQPRQPDGPTGNPDAEPANPFGAPTPEATAEPAKPGGEQPKESPVLFDVPPSGAPVSEEIASETSQPVQGLLFAPTARMLEAGAVSASGAIDTVGGAQLELKVGLGGVAEFGIMSTDFIRARDCATCDARTVRFVPMARFVMGLPEHRLFRHQPALAIGFQKSFARKHDARSSRYAMLYVVASKKLGSANLHGGAMLWDGEIGRDDSEVTLHGEPLSTRIRPTAGVEVLARERSHVIVDLTWNPELQIAPDLANPDALRLRPMLSWGVRYAAARRVALEAGVRVPDIGDANLLDAQIFAQLRVASRAVSSALGLQGS